MAVGAAAFARLQNNALFKATLTAAKSELAAANLATPDVEACEEESANLAMSH
jgi:hypothetical protein